MKIEASPSSTLAGLSSLRRVLDNPRVAGIASLLKVDLGDESIRNSVLARAEVNLQVPPRSAPAQAEIAATSALRRVGHPPTQAYINRAISAYLEVQHISP